MLPLPVAEEGSLQFPQRSENTRNCGLPLPVADAGGPQFPQPRHWRAVAEQAREWQCGKAGKRKPEVFSGYRKAASYALALLQSLSLPPYSHAKRLSFPGKLRGIPKGAFGPLLVV